MIKKNYISIIICLMLALCMFNMNKVYADEALLEEESPVIIEDETLSEENEEIMFLSDEEEDTYFSVEDLSEMKSDLVGNGMVSEAKGNVSFYKYVNNDSDSVIVVGEKGELTQNAYKTVLSLIDVILNSKNIDEHFINNYPSFEVGNKEFTGFSVRTDISTSEVANRNEEYKYVKITMKTYYFCDVLSGDNQVFDIKKDTNLTFNFDIDFEVFEKYGKVYIDANLVEPENYTVNEGIIFNDDFIKTLTLDEHNLYLSIEEDKLGIAYASFVIADGELSDIYFEIEDLEENKEKLQNNETVSENKGNVSYTKYVDSDEDPIIIIGEKEELTENAYNSALSLIEVVLDSKNMAEYFADNYSNINLENKEFAGFKIENNLTSNDLDGEIENSNENYKYIKIITDLYPTYDVLVGEDQVFDIQKDTNLTFRFDMDYYLFQKYGKVYIDGVLVDPENYEIKKGSTIIIFNDDFIKNLAPEQHYLYMSIEGGRLGRAGSYFVIRADYKYQSMCVDEKLTLDTELEGKINWTSSDKNTATVDENGTVTAKKLGQTIIKGEAENGEYVAWIVSVEAYNGIMVTEDFGDFSNDIKLPINWVEVKDQGIDFAILRYGTAAENDTDEYTQENYIGGIGNTLYQANKQGIKAGIMFNSRARSVEKAIEEADYLIENLRTNRNLIELPIIYNVMLFSYDANRKIIAPDIFVEAEDFTNPEKLKAASKICTEIVLAFSNRMAEYGYKTMIYFSNFAAEVLDMQELKDNGIGLMLYNYDTSDFSKKPVINGTDVEADLLFYAGDKYVAGATNENGKSWLVLGYIDYLDANRNLQEADLQELTRAMMKAEVVFEYTEKLYTEESVAALREAYNKAEEYKKNNELILETEQEIIYELATEINNAIDNLQRANQQEEPTQPEDIQPKPEQSQQKPEPSQPKPEQSQPIQNPATGDDSNIVMWTVMFIASAVGIVVTLRIKY